MPFIIERAKTANFCTLLSVVEQIQFYRIRGQIYREQVREGFSLRAVRQRHASAGLLLPQLHATYSWLCLPVC